MKKAKKKAIALFALFVMLYIAIEILLVVISFNGTLTERMQHLIATVLVTGCLLPLTLSIKKNADLAKVNWLQTATKFLLGIMMFWIPLSVIALIFHHY